MSRTLNLTCNRCRRTLWIGQRAAAGTWRIYANDEHTDALAKFIDEHLDHSPHLEDSEMVDPDFTDDTPHGAP